MQIREKYIFLIILLSFLISIFISFNFINKFDRLTSDLQRHMMIKDTVRGEWNKANELIEIKEKSFKNFFYKIDYDKAYLPPRIIALYFSIINEDIKDNNKLFKLDNKKYYLLVLQSIFYCFSIFFLSKVLLNKKENKNIVFFIILFLCFEPTLNQWHSSFFNESIFFSLQIIILAMFLKLNKNKIDFFLIGVFCGLLFLQKSVGLYYFFIIFLFLLISKFSEKIKKISLFLTSYLLICLFIGYTNFLRSNNFYLAPLQTKEAIFLYLLPKIYESKYDISFIEAKNKIINKTKIWIKENNIKADIQTNLFATSFGSEDDRIKIHTFQQNFTIDEMRSNILITTKILVKKYIHSLLINPVELYYHYKYENSDSYYKSDDHKKWVLLRMVYTFLILSISLYGLFTIVKTKKLNIYALFWVVSGIYFYLILGWVGFTRYFSPVLIYLSFFFANGMNQILFKKKNYETYKRSN